MDDESDSDSPAAALLVRRDSGDSNTSHRLSPTMTKLGTFRAYYLGCVVCIGGFLFGYDSGIVGKCYARRRIYLSSIASLNHS